MKVRSHHLCCFEWMQTTLRLLKLSCWSLCLSQVWVCVCHGFEYAWVMGLSVSVSWVCRECVVGVSVRFSCLWLYVFPGCECVVGVCVGLRASFVWVLLFCLSVIVLFECDCLFVWYFMMSLLSQLICFKDASTCPSFFIINVMPFVGRLIMWNRYSMCNLSILSASRSSEKPSINVESSCTFHK